LVSCSTSSARLRACKDAHSARLCRNVEIGRFPGARLQRCKRQRVAMRMGERADTRNHFCARCEGNQTASEPSLHACVREPNKPLSHLASLARAGLSAACEPGCGHPQTKRALNEALASQSRMACKVAVQCLPSQASLLPGAGRTRPVGSSTVWAANAAFF
jgi:hypothetical protein